MTDERRNPIEPSPVAALAIVGIGCLFPKSVGLGAYWANVKHGVDCITDVPPTHWNPDDYYDPDPKTPDMTYARRGGFLSVVDFQPLEFGMPPKDLEATDTSQLLGLVAAKQALTDAGVTLAGSNKPGTGKVTDRSRVSVILGVTGTLELVVPLGARLGHPHWRRALHDAGVPKDVAEDVVARIGESYVPWQENSFPGLLGNVVAGRIANKLDLHGTNCVVDAACASSLSAVHLAAMELQTGKADVVVTGGVDTFNDIFMYMCFSKTPALSPSGNAKPFDASGDGTILGEGIGMLVLKRLADAEREDDTIYAVIRGIGTSSDGKGNAIYAPSSEGQKRCLLNAHERAGVTPDTIELVEAHGTGTKVGDAAEATALTEVFRQGKHNPTAPWCAIGSVKSQIGHTKAAAGSASLIKAALSLYFKVLPPTIKVNRPVEPLLAGDSPFYVNDTMRPWLPKPNHPRRAGVSAFGFGGSNFHAILEEHRPNKIATDWDGHVELFAISGDTAALLAKQLADVPTNWIDFARAAEQSRATFRADAACRLVFAAHRTATDLTKLLANAKQQLQEQPTAKHWRTPEGVHYGSGAVAGDLAVLFPGQGSQYVGMLREVACLFPEMLETLTAANDTASRLSDSIYPPTSFADDAKATHDAALKATDVAQPALGAVSFGAWAVLSRRFGVMAQAFAGHSYGELPALAASGRIGEADLFTLSRLRGELMAAQRTGDAGAMLAVLASRNDVHNIIREESLDLVVANHNAPKQTVLSGPTDAIERAAKVFSARKVRSIRLPVAAAFHSSFVADAATPFRAALAEIAIQPGTTPAYSNTTAREYPADAEALRDLLGYQLANPVSFVDEVRNLARAGVRTFLEVGPGGTLTKLVEQILAETTDGIPPAAEFASIAIDASGGRSSGVLDLADALARLAARGHRVRLSAWEESSRARPPRPVSTAGTVPICGANYVQPRPKREPRPTAQLRATSSGEMPMPDSNFDPRLAAALEATQQTLATLQRMQEQTAQLHRQFLDSQEQAQRTLAALVAQQHTAFSGIAVGHVANVPNPVVPSVTYVPPPAPVFVPPPIPASIPVPVPQPVIVLPPPVPVAAPVIVTAGVSETLLSVVSEKTGYPVEMLNLEMSLDADLGIDSIKRVEILAAVQDKLPNAPLVKTEHLGSLHTLRDVANFLSGVPAIDGNRTEASESVEIDVPMATAVDSAEMSGGMEIGIGSDVSATLLGVVSEKTGYPVEMLNLDMSLDADLGIDSIKRVEILAAVQDKLPDAPLVKTEHLGSLHTLRDVANFLSGAPALEVPEAISALTDGGPSTKKIPFLVPSQIATPAPNSFDSKALDIIQNAHETPAPISEPNTPKTEHVSSILPAKPSESASPSKNGSHTPTIPSGTDSAKAGYTNDAVERSILQFMDMDLSADRAPIPLLEGGEIWLVAEEEPFTREIANQLAAMGYQPRLVPWMSVGTVKSSGALAGLVLVAPATIPSAMSLNRLAFQWVQTAGPRLRQIARQSSSAVIVTVARLDGLFGLGDIAPTADATAGGLAGLIKTLKHEWPEISCKAIDVMPAYIADEPAGAATAVIEEVLGGGPIEVGISPTHRCTLELARTVRRMTAQSFSLGPKDVVLITGGARGVTAEAAIALAHAYKCTLVLTGRTPTPAGPELAWSAGIVDEAALKKAIVDHLGADATPKLINEQFAKIVSQREIRQTLSRVESTGAKVVYFPVNVSSGRAVADLIHQVKVKFGPITAVVHGAGVLADRRIETLTTEQFDYVYSTKVDGIRHILDLLSGDELKAVVLFGSITGRMGRTGQLAYAVANEVLNKIAQIEARKRPNARVVSINWGPWDGGMVTPALRKLFESEGVGLIPLTAGGAFVVQELSTAGRAVEVLALGSKGRLSGAISSSATTRVPGSGSTAVPASPPNSNPPNSEVGVVFERVVDVPSHPILRSHVLDGRAVLPMAVHMEWMAHAALHGNPGLVFHGFNDLRITHGVMIEDASSITLRLMAGRAMRQEGLFVVPVEVRGKRRDGREVLHSRGEIVLTAAIPKAPQPEKPPVVLPYQHPPEDVYRYFLFHGPDLHGIETVDGLTDSAFIGTAYPAPATTEWFLNPLRSAWVADPLVLDASFQMMILWSFAQHGAGSLPCFLGRYRQFRRSFPAGPTRVVIRVTRDNGTFARADMDYLDSDGVLVAQVQDYECVIDPGLNQAFRRNQLGPLVRQ